jgi:hypothetical protein
MGLGDFLKDVGQGLVDLVTGHPQKAVQDVENAWDALKQTAQDAWDATKQLIDVGEDAIEYVVNGVVHIVQKANFWTEIGAAIGAGVCLIVAPECLFEGAILGALIGYAAGDSQATLRQLTPVERNLVNVVFKNTIDLDRVWLTDQSGIGGRAFTTPALNFTDKILVNIGSGAFTSPTTFTSSRYPAPGQLLIHELTHAWQIVTTGSVAGLVCDGLWTQLQYNLGTNVYALDNSFGSDWGAYGLEQQATIVDLWFMGGASAGHRYFRYVADNIRKRAPGGSSDPRFFNNLQWCPNCQGLVKNAAPGAPAGVCPNGGPHTPQTFSYMLRRNDAEMLFVDLLGPSVPLGGFVNWGAGWFLCSKCQGVVFAPPGGVCPAGGPHTFGSELYAPAMPDGDAAIANFFKNPDNSNFDPARCWDFCTQCNAMFWNAADSPSTCPVGGGSHTSGGTVYILEMYQP